MKSIRVACAIIEQNGRVLAAQRSEAMSMPLKWEFPGGKIKHEERPSECLIRELLEEMGIEVTVGDPHPPVTHSYLTFTVTLYPFVCRIVAGEITLHEHKAIAWMQPEELHMLDWADADWPVIDSYQKRLKIKGLDVG